MDEDRRQRISSLFGRWLTVLMIVLLPLLLDLSPVAKPLRFSLQRAQIAIPNGQNGEAAEALATALEWSPHTPKLRANAAQLALEAGEPALALDLVAEGRLPAAVDRSCLQAKALIALANPAEAVDRIEAAPPSCPPPIESIEALAQEALENQDAEAALSLYQKLVEYEPEQRSHWRRFGWTQAIVSPEQAIVTLQQVVRDSTNPDPLTLDLFAAIEEASLEQVPAYTFAQIGRTFVQHQRWHEARLALGRALELDSEYYEARAYYGLALLRLEKPELALDQLQQAHQLAPSAPLPASLLSVYWLEAGDHEHALEFAQIAHRADPENPAYTAQLAAALSASGDLQAAQSNYQEAITISGGAPEFWALLADFFIRHEMNVAQEGLQSARRAYRLQPSAGTADTLGYAHFLLGETRLAERYLQQALRFDPEFAAAHYHLGLALAEINETEDAANHLRRAMEIDPEGTWGQLAGRALERLD